jgi:conjugative transfer signal peptidase TraF
MGLLGIALLALACPKADAPVLLWNASASVPIGLYRVVSRRPPTGALAVVRLPDTFGTLADTRGYLRAGTLLIKPVAGGGGDIVCRDGPLVTINGRVVAHAKAADALGRPLPAWSGCFLLSEDQVFVLSEGPDSFDSRYFGPVERRHILGTALPVWFVARPPLRARAGATPALPQESCDSALFPLPQLFERGVQLRHGAHHLLPQHAEIGDRILFPAQQIEVETP